MRNDHTIYSRLTDGFSEECQRYKAGLISFESVCGYMQAMADIGWLSINDVKILIEWLQDSDTDEEDWTQALVDWMVDYE